ncbi:MAG: hypothetical protein JO112_03305, partial [Planctomycetes bacterium]|nr:hypothetical protein [Planctomycetota bacterium]
MRIGANGPAGNNEGRLPGRLLGDAAEVVVSRRGLGVLFLLGALVLTLGGWLRPPLSTDIRSLYIPLGICRAGQPTAQEMLQEPRRIPADSGGVLLLALLAGGLLAVLWRPRWFAPVA